MPRFKLADLVLDVAALEKAQKVIYCPWPRTIWTRFHCWYHWPWTICHWWISWCRPIRSLWLEVELPPEVCPGGSKIDMNNIFDDWDDPRELEGLKEQLTTALGLLEKRQAALEGELQPKTAKEADEIGKALDAAQAQLKEIRAKLK